MLTEEVASLFGVTEQWGPNSKFVLGHDPEFILMVFCQTSDYKGTLLRVIRDMDPRFSVVLTLLHNVVSDLRTTIICGGIPGEANPLCKDLSELDRSDRGARWSWRKQTIIDEKTISCDDELSSGNVTGATQWLSLCIKI